jgi:hypothetical protein
VSVGLRAARIELADRLFVDRDAEAWALWDGDVGVYDGDLLGRDLVAVLEWAHQVGGVGEAWEGGGEVEAHGGGASRLMPCRLADAHLLDGKAPII